MSKVTPNSTEGQQEEGEYLFVGCDIGHEKHSVAILDSSGKALQEIRTVYNSRKGFGFLGSRIEYWKERTGAKKVRFGFEPTGCYWQPLAHYFKDKGIELCFIKTTALKAMRVLTDSTNSKNDERDAMTLALLVKEGKVLKSPIPEGIWRELRSLVSYRERMEEEYKALLQRLGSMMDVFFPELHLEFPKKRAMGLWLLLEEAPFPGDLVKKSERWLSNHLRRWTRREKSPEERAKALMEAARGSIGVEPGDGDRKRISSILRLLMAHKRELREIENEMEEVLKKTGYADILLSFPGIGTISAAILIGEMGNPENFQSARQLISFAGIDPSEKRSGDKCLRNKISKKGRPRMRTNLYYMALSGINHCQELRKYYDEHVELIDSGKLKLEKMQLLMAVAIKQIKIIFAMLRDKTFYQPDYAQLRQAA